METPRSPYLLALAPLVVVAHIAEETPGLISWLNRHVEPGLTMTDFVAINTIGVLVTVVIAVPSVRSPNYVLALVLIAWLSFVMLANGVVDPDSSPSR